MVERVTRKNENLESELPLTISAQYGLIDQNEFFDKRIASRDVSGYYLLKKGEFAYNKSTSSDAPWGAVKRLDRYEMGVLSTLYIVFALKEDGNIDSDFLVSYYDTDCWHKGVQAIAAEGARNHGLLNITPADYFETVLTVPSNVKEQHQIGTFFAKLDSLITLHQRECFSFDFSGESAKTAQKTISWEQRKLNEYLTVSTKKNTEDKYDKTDVLSVSGEVGVVNQIEFQGRSFAGASVSNYGVVETGDVVYTKSPLRANPYGIIKANKGKSGIVSTLYAVYKTIQGTANADFIECYFDLDDRLNMYLKPLVNIGAKHDMKVTDENALKGGVLFPSYEEQCQIADFFSRLDTLITLHQHKPNKKGHDVLSVMPFKGNQRKPHYLCT